MLLHNFFQDFAAWFQIREPGALLWDGGMNQFIFAFHFPDREGLYEESRYLRNTRRLE
jgi:hypothetical protein